jgi:glycosyltransferase involved in cell wall biosynthesis
MTDSSQAPFVSVIVPVYNGGQTIAACLESLLAQAYDADRYEVLVVDNN